MIEKIRLFYFIRKKQSLKYQIMIILMEEHLRARLNYDSICTYDGGNEIWFDRQTWEKMKKKIYKYISKNYKDKFNYFDDDYILGLFSDEKEFCHLDKNNVHSSEDNNEINITDNFSEKHEKTKNNVHSSEDNNEINITDSSSEKHEKTKNNVHSSEDNNEINITDNFSEKHEKTKNDNNYSSIFKITFLMKDKGYSYQYNNYQRSGTKLQKRANQFVLITLIYYILSWLVKDPLITFKILLEKILKIIFHIKIDFEVIPTILFTIFLLGIIRKIFDNK